MFSRYLFAFLVAGYTMTSAHAHAESNQSNQKHYLDEQSVQISKNGLHVLLRDDPIHVKTIRSDHKGVYIYESDIITLQKKLLYRCGRCSLVTFDAQLFRHHKCRS